MNHQHEQGNRPVVARADTAVGRRCRRRHGSALILTIVTLVMMVLLGTAMIQIARVDRRATRELTVLDNMDTVKDAVIAYMQQILRDDIVISGTDLFNEAAGIEPYDYPGHNITVGFTVNSVYDNSSLGQAHGGRLDDTWLASTTTDSRPANDARPEWTQISNLNGVFLKLPKTSNTVTPQGASSAKMPKEDVINGTANQIAGPKDNGNSSRPVWVGQTTNVYMIDGTAPYDSTGYTGETIGVDADGDGIEDSRWTWAPEEVRQIGASMYIVAYRIVDLSSMINVNVATGLRAGGTGKPTDPRGFFPTDTDISRLLEHSVACTNLAGEYAALMSARTLPTTLPMPPGTANLTANPATYTGAANRAGAWISDVPGQLGAAYYGYTSNRFGVDDELELRALGGINTPIDTPLEVAMPTALRKNAHTASPPETDYDSVKNLDGTTKVDRMMSYMTGGKEEAELARAISGNPALHGYAGDRRNYPAMRQLLTTMGGASILAPRYPGMTSLERLPYDLTQQHDAEADPPTTRVDAIYSRLKKIFTIGNPQYMGLGASDIDQIAAEYAVAIQDYSDLNAKPTGKAIGGKTYYGLERLPFIKEVYLQAGYKGDPATTMDPGTGMKEYTKWKPMPASAAIAVEVGNPFDKEIDFSKAKVRLRVMQGSTQRYASSDFGSVSSGFRLPARDNGAMTEEAIFFSQAQAANRADENGKGSDLMADLNLGSIAANKKIDLGDGAGGSIAFDATDLTIELQVQATGGAWVTYDRVTKTGLNLPATINFPAGTVENIGNEPEAHLQLAVARDGRNTRYISNSGITLRKRDPLNPNSYQTTYEYLGEDNKGLSAPEASDLDKLQIAIADRQVFNVSELGYIFMFGFFDGADGDFPTRLSGKDGTGTAMNGGKARRFLWFPANGSDVPNATKVPHASMVFDHFTTFSPRYDKYDNDNADGDDVLTTGADNSDVEQFVAGKMNVNTAPAFLMALAAGLPEAMDPDIYGLFHKIHEYREHPENRVTLTGLSGFPRNDPDSDRGFRSMGELLLVGAGAGNSNQNMLRYATDGVGIAGTDKLRIHPHPDDSLATTYDGNEYAAQERMVRFHFLNNMLSVRSDRFVAYVVIRGYNASDFTGAPTESLRFLVLLDRSNVISQDDTPNVLGYQKN